MYVPRKKYLDASGRPNRSGSAELTGSVRFGQPNQNRTKTLHKSYFILTNEEIHPKFLNFRILHMRKYLLHQFMTAFVAFRSISYLRNRQKIFSPL